MSVNGNGQAVTVTWASLLAALTMALAIIGGAVGILNWIYAESNRMRAEITAVRVDMASTQVSKNEFKDALKDLASQIDGRLARIEKHLVKAP